MEIQWIIITRGFKTNEDTTHDIYGIFHRIRIFGKDNKASMLLLAKVKINQAEVGGDKNLILDIAHENEGRLVS